MNTLQFPLKRPLYSFDVESLPQSSNNTTKHSTIVDLCMGFDFNNPYIQAYSNALDVSGCGESPESFIKSCIYSYFDCYGYDELMDLYIETHILVNVPPDNVNNVISIFSGLYTHTLQQLKLEIDDMVRFIQNIVGIYLQPQINVIVITAELKRS